MTEYRRHKEFSKKMKPIDCLGAILYCCTNYNPTIEGHGMVRRDDVKICLAKQSCEGLITISASRSRYNQNTILGVSFNPEEDIEDILIKAMQEKIEIPFLINPLQLRKY